MNKFFLAGAAALMLAACGRDEAITEPASEQPAAAETDDRQDAPELGAFGIATKYIDESVDPGDDFNDYVSGEWLATFKIPDEYSSYGSFTTLVERSEERVRNIIEDLASAEPTNGAIEQKIGDFYASYLDLDAINAAGLEPAAGDFARIDAISSPADLAAAFADPSLPAGAPIGAFIDVDAKDPEQYAVYVTQAGLGMPNRDYYLQEKFAEEQAAYRRYIEKMLSLADVDDAAAKAEAIYGLEVEMAKAHWEPAKRRNRDLTYNPKSAAGLKAFAPGTDWDALIAASGLEGQSQFIVREDDAIQKLAALVESTPLDTWKSYLKFHLLRNMSDVLPEPFDDATFAFYGTELRGTLKIRERWKRGVDALDDALGEAVGKIYVDRYFPAASKAQMEALVANLRKALKQRIAELEWMGEETKAQALDKLEKFTPKIAYPDKWRDYSGLVVKRGDAYGNAVRAKEFQWAFEVDRLDDPVDRGEWGMTPQTVNAYYNPTLNEIVFPAAILQAPFFDPNADPAVNYGAIGAVIGHEMGHGFDDQGRKSDGAGILRDWWTEEDAAAFQELADRLGAQYATYEPVPGFSVNPTLTMGENIGDLGGLNMAYHAYKLSLDGKEAPVIGGLTGDQRFFMAWAQVWRRVVREEQLKNQVTADPHSPAEYRVNGVVRNMDAWYEAFNVTEDDELYLPPEERVQIW